MLVFISPSSRYALLDTADLPLTIRETTVDYQVQSKVARVAGIQREGDGKIEAQNVIGRGWKISFPLSLSPITLRSSGFPPLL